MKNDGSYMSSAKMIIVVLCLFLSMPVLCYADGVEQVPSSPKDIQSPRLVSEAHDTRLTAITKNTKPLSNFELAKYQYCGKDSDCIPAINGCCDCANGGIEVAVSKERFKTFSGRFNCLHVACGEKEANAPCGGGVVSCIHHKCKYFAEGDSF